MMGLSFGLCRVTLSRIRAKVPHSTPHSASVEETFRPIALGSRRRMVGLRRATVSRRLAIALSLEANAEQTDARLPRWRGGVTDLAARSARARGGCFAYL